MPRSKHVAQLVSYSNRSPIIVGRRSGHHRRNLCLDTRLASSAVIISTERRDESGRCSGGAKAQSESYVIATATRKSTDEKMIEERLILLIHHRQVAVSEWCAKKRRVPHCNKIETNANLPFINCSYVINVVSNGRNGARTRSSNGLTTNRKNKFGSN